MESPAARREANIGVCVVESSGRSGCEHVRDAVARAFERVRRRGIDRGSEGQCNAPRSREPDAFAPSAESSADIRVRVNRARRTQQERFAGEHVFCNTQMTPRLIRKHCQLQPSAQQMLERAITKWGLSARAYDRILKVSRTIADLEGVEQIVEKHISEAVQFRTLDRTFWQ